MFVYLVTVIVCCLLVAIVKRFGLILRSCVQQVFSLYTPSTNVQHIHSLNKCPAYTLLQQVFSTYTPSTSVQHVHFQMYIPSTSVHSACTLPSQTCSVRQAQPHPDPQKEAERKKKKTMKMQTHPTEHMHSLKWPVAVQPWVVPFIYTTGPENKWTSEHMHSLKWPVAV